MRVAFDVGPVKARPAGVGIYARSLAGALADVLGRDELRLIGRRPEATGLPNATSLERRSSAPYPLWATLFGGLDARCAGADVAHFADGLVPAIRSGPTVVTVHDLSIVRHWRAHQLKRLPRIPLVLASPHLADRVIADSTATADELIRLARIPARKIDVILLAPRPGAGPADDATVTDALSRHGLERGRYLLAPGTIEPRKNHVRLVAAYTRLVERREIADDIQLVIAGGEGWGSGPALRAIADSPATPRIRRLGYVPDDDVTALMTAAAVVVYPSTYEGFGLPIVEAMACGAPVVTSNVSSMPEAAGGAAVLVDPFDVEDIARGVVDALGAAADLAAASRVRAGRLSWASTAAATVSTYEVVTG
jgi:glycosyltransferase involved in cell wall biosynthesis